MNERRLLFFGRGDRYWLNELARPCLGIGWRSSISVLADEASVVCRGDTIVATGRSGSRCTLGRFTKISGERAEELVRQTIGAPIDSP